MYRRTPMFCLSIEIRASVKNPGRKNTVILIGGQPITYYVSRCFPELEMEGRSRLKNNLTA